MAQLKPYSGTFYLWKYVPSLPAAILFIVLFAGVTSALCWRMVKTRSWFCLAFVVGGLCQVIGYSIRVWSHYYTEQLVPYVLQNCFIIIAPVLYAASIHIALGRLIRSVNGDCFSIIRPSLMTKLFLLGDLFSLAVQGRGAGMLAKTQSEDVAGYIITAGLFLQLVLFACFVVAASVFHKRMRDHVTKTSQSVQDIPWRQGLRMLYACSGLIIIRSIFRIIEYLMEADAYLMATEWPIYVFDGTLMLAVAVAFCVWFPDKFPFPQVDCTQEGNELV